MLSMKLRASSPSLVKYIDSIKDSWTATSRNTSLSGLTFQQGDVGILFFITHSGGTRSGDPSGWTSIGDFSTSGYDYEVYTRELQSGDTQIAWSGSNATRIESAIVLSFRGASVPTASNISNVYAGPPDYCDPPVVPITARPSDYVVAAGAGSQNNSSDSITSVPSGYSFVQNIDQWDGTYGHVLRVARKAEPDPAENPSPFTTAGADSGWSGTTLLLQAK